MKENKNSSGLTSPVVQRLQEMLLAHVKIHRFQKNKSTDVKYDKTIKL